MNDRPSDQSGKVEARRGLWRLLSTFRLRRRGVLLCGIATVLMGGTLLRSPAQDAKPADATLAQLMKIPAATLSDAMDEVVGRRGFMSYDMRPVSFTRRMAGRAKTVKYGPATDSDPKKNIGPRYAIQIIDESGPGDVLVAVTGDLNITGLGGLMARTANVRGMEGVVVDGAVRDVAEIEEFGMPVFTRSISPSTMVGRSTSLTRDVPVMCGGVTVAPGDYIIGDRDGVVCVPAGQIDRVIKRAMEMEEAEMKMRPMIRKFKSLQKVVDMFKRI